MFIHNLRDVVVFARRRAQAQKKIRKHNDIMDFLIRDMRKRQLSRCKCCGRPLKKNYDEPMGHVCKAGNCLCGGHK